MRLAIEQRLGGHQHSGYAVAALCGAEISEALLKRVEASAGRQTFHRFDTTPLRFDREQEARQHRLAIGEYRTRAALAEFAAMLGAGEPQIFTEHFEQRLIVFRQKIHRLVVDRAPEAKLHPRCS